MIKKLALPLLLCFQFGVAYSQSAHNSVSDYDYYTFADREPIYRDEFNDTSKNNKEWLNTNDTYFLINISNGCLVITNNGTDYTASDYTLKFEYLRDFELEISAKVESPKRRDRSGILFWGRDSSISKYNGQFLYFSHGKHILFNQTGAETENYRLPLPDFTFNDKKDFNIYTIRKVKGG